MSQIDMVMPQMGESIAEGTILKWLKKAGDKIERDETILEISTDKVDSEIPAPTSGVLAKILVEEGTTVDVGTPIAVIATDGRAAAGATSQDGKEEQVVAKTAPSAAVQAAAPVAASADGGEIVARKGDRFYSPLVRSIAQKENVSMTELESITATGANNRVTKNDLLAYLKNRSAPMVGKPSVATPTPAAQPQVAPPPAPTPAPIEWKPGAREEVMPMDNMRRRIAEHMVMSKQTSPHVYSVSECDMTQIVKYREGVKKEFEQREGTKLTYTPFFIDAVVRAIKDFPMINSSIDGANVIIKKYVNLGIAVALENGLIVPVIKDTDSYNLVGLARVTNDIAYRARNKQLKPDEHWLQLEI